MEPTFKPNYPFIGNAESARLLTTPERVGATDEVTGQGVTIAFIDSGFYRHPDLDDRIQIHVDATTNTIVEQVDQFPVDVMSWHGQMTSVIAAGNGHDSGGVYRGIAPGAELVLIRVSNKKYQVKEADIQRGFKWLVENHQRYNIRVVNVSVGGDIVSDNANHPLHKAVRDLTEAGVCVVMASGNKGLDTLVPPASSAEGITVGGYEDHNTLDRQRWTTYSSNWGRAYDGTAKPDLVAPARWIASPILPETTVAKEAHLLGRLLENEHDTALHDILAVGTDLLDLNADIASKPNQQLYDILQQKIHAHKLINTHYQHVDGTSVAAPIVSAVIAQMLEANPALTPVAVRTILRETALPIPNIASERQGAGAINAAEAVRRARQYSLDSSRK